MGTQRHVTSTDGIRIAIFEDGPAEDGPNPAIDPPVVVCIHGFPDNHTVWDGVVATLSATHRTVSYDVRGAGQSDKPRERSAYHLDQLERDFIAVIDAVSPDRPVHMLAHDWGSIQAWHFATDPVLRDRIASLTSISGPDLDQTGHWLGSRRGPRAAAQALRQLGSSYYIALFQLPWLPEQLLGSRLGERMVTLGQRLDGGRATGQRGYLRSRADRTNGIQLYRANMLPHRCPATPRSTDIPVQVLVPSADRYVSAALQQSAPLPFASDLRIRRIVGGHWLPIHHPEVVARVTAELVAHVEGGPESPALFRARATIRTEQHGAGQHGAGQHLAGQLALVTGAGSGIGRHTCLELAGNGAAVIVTDLDARTAEQTAALVRATGAQAWAYQLDVADAAAWDRLAARLSSAHGVPDIVVNNAGIGMAGGFLDTTLADWKHIVDVNFWGVLHGCRVFAAQIAGRGAGGRIVNVASAAAYSPSRSTVAYSTTKAAVLMLSECLAAELAPAGIVVTAICPGFINTSIAATTRYVGTDAETEQSLRAQAVRAYQRRNYSPERAAKHIVNAIRGQNQLVTVTPEAKLLLALDRFAPRLQRRLARAALPRR